MKQKPLLKLFVVRKYILATNVAQALKKEPGVKPDDCWLDEGWKAMAMKPTEAIGFNLDKSNG